MFEEHLKHLSWDDIVDQDQDQICFLGPVMAPGLWEEPAWQTANTAFFFFFSYQDLIERFRPGTGPGTRRGARPFLLWFLGRCTRCQLLDDVLHVSQITEAFLLPEGFDWKVMLPCCWQNRIQHSNANERQLRDLMSYLKHLLFSCTLERGKPILLLYLTFWSRNKSDSDDIFGICRHPRQQLS